MQKIIPILFSAAMVQALLAGNKTQTRRAIKGKTGIEHISEEAESLGAVYDVYRCEDDGELYGPTWLVMDEDKNVECVIGQCPYGKPGDVLWGRENWRVHSWYPDDGEIVVGFNTDDKETITCYDLNEGLFNRLWEQSCDDLSKAGYEIDADENYSEYDVKKLRLRPSIHMPKEAARIWLRVKDVRVEKVQDISEQDAKAEGMVPMWEDEHGNFHVADYRSTAFLGEDGEYKVGFKKVWCDINGKESWETNPWVWVVEFEVLSTNGKPEQL
jgi:hypothetical protein